jgi:hypothetical protein
LNIHPQGLSSLFGSFGGGQQGGGIGNLVSGMLGGVNNNNQDPAQQKRKGVGLGDMLGFIALLTIQLTAKFLIF